MVKGKKNAGIPLIVGQGLAGTCLAWELLERGIDFRIVDLSVGGSTRVAAGLINPITGKNFEPSWRIQEFYPDAMGFYQMLENHLEETLWHSLPLQRLADSEKEWMKISSKFDLSEVAAWLTEENLPTPQPFFKSLVLKGAGWLDTQKFLQLSKNHFQKIGLFQEKSEGAFLIRCEGAAGLIQRNAGSHRCAKGEILTVKAEWPQSHIRIGAGGWLVPIGDRCFRIGSTYDWNDLDEKPTPTGLAKISELAKKLGGKDFEILAHVAGIRPILRRSQPLIGQDEQGDWLFNGLGSKGTLYAPRMAKMLADWIFAERLPEAEFILSTELCGTHNLSFKK